MAAPVVETTATTDFDSNATSHLVTMPSGVVSGNLLIVVWSNDESATVTSKDWTEFKTLSPNSESRISAFYKQSDGTEGATEDFVTSTSQQGGSIAYRVSGAANPSTQAPDVSTGVEANSSSPNPDAVTPSGGSDDYLWIAVSGCDSDAHTGGPANMSNFLEAGTSIANNGGHSSCGSSENTTSGTSFNPDTFTMTSSDHWGAFTVAVYPSTGIVILRRRREFVGIR